MATPTATPKLPDLARRIAQQEAALAVLRRKLDARLTDLNRRREKLRTELRTVEAEIEAVSQGDTQSGKPATDPAATPQATSKRPPTAPAKQRPGSGPSLSEFLVRLVREGKGKPLAITELQEQTLRRGFRSSSANLPRMVKKRAYELVERGLLGRDPSTGGFILPHQGKNGSKAAIASPSSKPLAAARPRAQSATPAAKSPSAPVAVVRNGQASLRSVLLTIMKKEGRTLSAQELANRAKRAGYRTRSKNFKDVIWVAVRNMPEAEHDPRGGYRLKKR